MKITRINHCAVNVHGHSDEAREFYTEFLGLPEVPIQLPGHPPLANNTTGGFWLQLDGIQVHVIGLPTNGEPGDPTGPHVSWYVADLDEAIRELAERNMILKTIGEGRNRIVWFADPSGNTVEIQQDPDH